MYKLLFLLLNVYKSAKDVFYTFIYRHSLPVVPKNDDVWIVEYPKSGITWLTFLIANINVKMSGKEIDVNFFNFNDFVSDIHSSRYLPHNTELYPGFRFIKSHSTGHRYYHKIIYLIRDPRAVLISYRKFLVGLNRNPDDISSIIRSKRYGIDAWVNHVNSWINNISLDKRIYFIRYEDLIDDTTQCMEDLYLHMGLKIPEEIISYAVEQSSLQNMKLKEEQWKAADIKYSGAFSGFEFVGEGKKKGYKEVLSKDDLNYIESRAGHLMKLFGYQ